MVARNRCGPVNLGFEKAQDVRGFSRISPKVFEQNKHSGLYYASTRKWKKSGGVNGRYAKKNQQRNYSSVKSKSNGQKGSKFARYSNRQCNFKNVNDQQNAETFQVLVNPARMSRPVKSKKRQSLGSKHQKAVGNKTQQDIDDALLNFKLRGVMKKFESSFSNVEEIKLTRGQYIRKLNVLNELIWNCEELSGKARKAKGTLISNQVKGKRNL